MAKTYTVTDIQYDTDGKKIKGLPKELIVEVPDDCCETPDEINDYISDEISNRTGWCHTGFSTEPKIEGYE